MTARTEHDSHLLGRLIENLATATLVFGADLTLEYMNPAAEMLMGASMRKVRGKPLSCLLQNAGDLEQHLQRAHENGQAFNEHELQLVLASGKHMTVDCMISAIIEPGEPGIVIVEMQQVDRHLRISREETLLAQNMATRALIRGVAHEVKNPLGGLRGAAQLLERELPNEALKEYTHIIIGEADRLQNLVDKMLGPNDLPDMGMVNIHEVLERVRSLSLAEVSQGVEIKRDYDTSIPEFIADKDMLIQAVLNIVRNAIQAVAQNGVVVLKTRVDRQYTIGNTRYRHVVRIDVIDNGPGIEEDMLESIFYPMVTTREEGTGLGLSIAQSLINRHNGIIECESRKGETIFTIRIPLITEKQDEQG
ncbi:MAG: nitrogen regulation protein NR(II) [Granulosicoccaceae bacterium]|jgi:two-component system nitrogen regulation sensor histidine kinase GlnL